MQKTTRQLLDERNNGLTNPGHRNHTTTNSSEGNTKVNVQDNHNKHSRQTAQVMDLRHRWNHWDKSNTSHGDSSQDLSARVEGRSALDDYFRDSADRDS